MTYQQSVLIGLKIIKCKSLLLSLESQDKCIVFIQMQISVNADFAVSVDTTSISVTWADTDVDGVSSFSIKLDTEENGHVILHVDNLLILLEFSHIFLSSECFSILDIKHILVVQSLSTCFVVVPPFVVSTSR